MQDEEDKEAKTFPSLPPSPSYSPIPKRSLKSSLSKKVSPPVSWWRWLLPFLPPLPPPLSQTFGFSCVPLFLFFALLFLSVSRGKERGSPSGSLEAV